jgi:FAD dependent oxidoreductase
MIYLFFIVLNIMKKNIIIIGSGWYGLHIAYKYQNKYNITVLEKNPEIFMESSYNNQNRLHLGFHYPRSYKTRQLCKNGYKLFLEDYNKIVDKIDKNYYCISNDSLIDFETYIHIFDYEDYKFDILENNIGIKNINGSLIKVDEMLINHDKAKKFFLENLKNVQIIRNYEVKTVRQNNNCIYVNNDLKCDFLLNCTYGKFSIDNNIKNNNNYLYELTISFVYKKIKEYDADCITLMDGNLPSLFIRNKKDHLYSLTHVKYTPLFRSLDKHAVLNYIASEEEIENSKMNMESDIKKYIPEFDDIFKYDSYYFGYKLKKNDKSDDRTCNIEKNGNIISVNGGKITGIYNFEAYFNQLNL